MYRDIYYDDDETNQVEQCNDIQNESYYDAIDYDVVETSNFIIPWEHVVLSDLTLIITHKIPNTLLHKNKIENEINGIDSDETISIQTGIVADGKFNESNEIYRISIIIGNIFNKTKNKIKNNKNNRRIKITNNTIEIPIELFNIFFIKGYYGSGFPLFLFDIPSICSRSIKNIGYYFARRIKYKVPCHDFVIDNLSFKYKKHRVIRDVDVPNATIYAQKIYEVYSHNYSFIDNELTRRIIGMTNSKKINMLLIKLKFNEHTAEMEQTAMNYQEVYKIELKTAYDTYTWNSIDPLNSTINMVKHKINDTTCLFALHFENDVTISEKDSDVPNSYVIKPFEIIIDCSTVDYKFELHTGEKKLVDRNFD